ncbi:MAG: phosphotransferase [Gorillibacterium sp.]|nr:phosphotransferase [Gorillibacterium sp.]
MAAVNDHRGTTIVKSEDLESGAIDLNRLKEEIICLQGCSLEQIHKGFSNDKKFAVQSAEGTSYLLRLFEADEFEHKQIEFTILQQMLEHHVTCSRPIELGMSAQAGYMLLSFVEGNDATEELPHYTQSEQFHVGVEAGRELKKINSIQAPDLVAPWYDRKIAKHKRYMDAYAACGYKVKQDEQIIAFIDENIKFMQNRPNLFQHDDFHVGNLIVKDKRLAGVIDFNRYDWGDPIHEFLKVGIFSREISTAFSIGQIKGYHNNEEPREEFWRLYALYLAMSVFSTVVWTLSYFPENMDEMMSKVERFLDDHDYFARIIPNWYTEGF